MPATYTTRQSNVQKLASIFSAALLAFGLSACVKSDVVELSEDTLSVFGRVPPACDKSFAEALAMETASIETLRRGFDGFTTINIKRGDQTLKSTIVGSGYSSTSTSYHPYQTLTIKMQNRPDQPPEGYTDAKERLGPDWERKLQHGPPLSC